METESDSYTNNIEKTEIINTNTVTDSIQYKLKQYVQFEDEKKQINEQLKKIKNQQSSLQHDIINHMELNNIPQFNLNKCRIKLSSTTSKSNIKQKDFEEILKKHVDDNKVKNILRHIEEARTVKNQKNLKHSSKNNIENDIQYQSKID